MTSSAFDPPGVLDPASGARAPDSHTEGRKGLAVVAVVAAVALVLFVVLAFRASGLYPVVMADEYTYSKFSRLDAFSASTIPSYLYLFVYRVTSVCGDQFLSCARLLNCLFFVAGGGFVYLVARRFAGRSLAVWVALLAVVSPMSSVTVYFMPEAPYFFAFWSLSWLVLATEWRNEHLKWAVAGLAAGAASLVKPHALFLVPALVGCIAFQQFARSRDIATIVAGAGVFVGGLVASKFGMGFLIAGTNGLTWFGPLYTAIAGAGGSESRSVAMLVGQAASNFEGHLLSICLLFGLPLAICLGAGLRAARRPARAAPESTLCVYATLTFCSLVPVVCLFTASVAGAGPYETVGRLHMRYYDFALPLLLLVAASRFTPAPGETSFRLSRLLPGVGVAAVIFYAAFGGLARFTPNFIDAPTLQGIATDPTAVRVFALISIATVLLWTWRRHIGTQVFLLVLAPLSIAVADVAVQKELAPRAVPDAYDQAASVARSTIPPEERPSIALVGPNPGAMFRTLFHLDLLGPQIVTSGATEPIDYAKVGAGEKWLIVFADELPTTDDFQVTSFQGFALVRSTYAGSADFDRSKWPGFISAASGLSTAERWGTWSLGRTVTIDFARPLPRRLGIRLTANAFGPNIGRDFVARVGSSATRFTLGASPTSRVLEFDNESGARRLTIEVPAPASPLSLGVSANDDRELGIGLVQIRLVRR